MQLLLLLSVIFGIAFVFYFIKEKVYSERISRKESLLQKTLEQVRNEQRELNDSKTRLYNNLKQKELSLSEREAALPSNAKAHIFSHALKILSHDYFRDTLISRHLSSFSYPDLMNDPYFLSATTKKRIMKYPLKVIAEVTGEKETYTVTLDSCTCPSFVHRRTPCKHMYQLALEMGVLFYFKDRFWTDLKKREDEFSAKSTATLKKIDALEEKTSLELKSLNAQKDRFLKQKKELLSEVSEDALNAFFSEKKQTYPWFAKIFADYVYTLDCSRENSTRSLQGSKASEERKRLRLENRDLTFRNKLLEHQLAVYESVAPWLLDFKELSPEEVISEMSMSNDGIGAISRSSDYESLKTYLSESEYNKLSDSEKYQLALDRWKKRSKSNWVAGIDYERYIGYLYELKNYNVKFQGALCGFDDMGIDIVASKGKNIYLIQCKRYSEQKTVHENTVFQLYGSYVYCKTQNPSRNFIPVIYTTTKLSDVAQKCADFLNIEVHSQHPLEEYPLIKCNISPNSEKIYHLPFDQQYDRILISPKKGEFYASTVQEAEDSGFRRAFRWHSKT